VRAWQQDHVSACFATWLHCVLVGVVSFWLLRIANSLLGFFVFPSRAIPKCERSRYAMFSHAAQHGCAISRAQLFPLRHSTPILVGVFVFQVEECRGVIAAARPCSSTLRSMVAPYLGLNRFIFRPASPQHALFFCWRFLFSESRGAGVRVW
jgi:hypothetical protein